MRTRKTRRLELEASALPARPADRLRRAAVGAAAVGLALTGLPTPAFAVDKHACVVASDEGQALRIDGKLVQARERLLVCADPTCPAIVRDACATWVVDVERQVPSVLLIARDRQGRDVPGVRVSIDGAERVGALDGRSIPLDPGSHRLAFAFEQGETVERVVVLAEGEQRRLIEAIVPSTGGRPVDPSTTSAVRPGASWRTAGWAVGAVGAIGLGAGTAFGIAALTDKNRAGCDTTTHTCDAAPLADAKSAATASTIGFVLGGALLASGVSLVLFAPRSSPSGGRVALAPWLATRDGGLTLEGAW